VVVTEETGSYDMDEGSARGVEERIARFRYSDLRIPGDPRHVGRDVIYMLAMELKQTNNNVYGNV